VTIGDDMTDDDATPFQQLDFIYSPCADVAAERDHVVEVLGARPVFAIEAYGTRVAMLELSDQPPALLLTDHVAGERPILVYRVADLEAAKARLESQGWEPAATFEIPHGPCCSFATPGGHRIALYELTRPEVPGRFPGRHDF